MRKLLAIMFISLFIFQVLPIKQIGKILWDGQMTEEVHEHGHSHKKMSKESDDKLWYHHFCTSFSAADIAVISISYFLHDEALIKCHHMDVLVQPPNFA